MPPTTSAARVNRTVLAPPSAVWAVLSDGWLYSGWVVGASRIRGVDSGWPGPGARIHHSVGSWPALLDDETRVLRVEPQVELVLQARAWPAGEATVHLALAPASGDRTEVTIAEDATAGPGRLIPKPIRQLLITPRNRESLRRLALIAEGRQA
jgi:uncharacterized protein YndB with AHSA1/START domain